MKSFVCLILIAIAPLSFAGIYMQEDKGNITYSDTPLNSKAKAIVLPSEQSTGSIQSIKTLPSAPQTNATTTPAVNTTDASSERKPYTTFAIVSPKNEQTIANQPNLTVLLQVVPDLQDKDKIQVYLDGMPSNPPSSTMEVTLGFIERGQHVLSAKLIDEKNQVLKESEHVTIYIQRMGVNSPARADNSATRLRTLVRP